MIDMDVNILYITKDETKELGMVVPLKELKLLEENQEPIKISLESVVKNIVAKKFYCLRANI
jgi:hypothetical protein